MGEKLSKRKTSSRESFIANVKLYGYPEAQARIQLDAAIEEAISNAAQGGVAFKLSPIAGEDIVQMTHSRCGTFVGVTNDAKEVLLAILIHKCPVDPGIDIANPDESG